MIKAAFFDMDGTIYSHESKSVPESTIKAIEALKKRGIRTFLATGRHFAEIDEFSVGDILFDGYVMLNGQICTDAERNLIYGNPINGEDAEYLLNAFVNKNIPLMLLEEDCLYVNLINETVEAGQEAISSALPEIKEYMGAPIYQIVCYGDEELEAELKSKLPNCKITRWSPYGIDIISKIGGKVAGISKVLDHYGWKREEIIAFGDWENDIEMIRFAGIGVAMGNGNAEIKEAADYVTSDIDDDGIWNGCRHFGLIE